MAEREYYDLVKRFVINKLKCNPRDIMDRILSGSCLPEKHLPWL
jgi:hypothetical protein